ncbi:MAG: single-stranded DNA-binding protein [Prevotella sp.]|nr:single-stranded DNA-binding protein [Prevotella sp.]
MLYTHFIARIGKDAQVVNGSKGDFLSMDVAVSDYFKGQETTTWVRVRSNRHLKLQQWLTKGRLVLIEGSLSKPSIWTDKKGEEHVQISVTADNIQFVSTGKKKEDGGDTPKAVDPMGMPVDNTDDAPF